MSSRYYHYCLFLFLASLAWQPVFAQLGFDLKVDKPEPYQSRVLRAEKSGEKPLRKPKKFLQNLTTHYNYYFNATNKLNEVIEGAKSSFKDDYTILLPFYNYTLDATSQNASQLDSVIYKSQTGIVMHDLRNDWIDNLYLLWGASWFFQKKFDSAALMFQFINYAFAQKEKDGYYKYIGSRMDGNNALNIATKENRQFPKNMVTPPSRNQALIWQVRTLIELGNLPEAGSLIVTLKNDPLFPARLKDDLEEVQAYWFYQQHAWDSSAIHLTRALGQVSKKQEQARWEYLAAQLFEKSENFEEAQKYFAKSITHTTDPVMDIYARLNMVRISKADGENSIDKNIAELVKMAKRDKYADYRDVIYFMAARMEMERNNFAQAQELLLKGAKYNNAGFESRNKSFLLIADLSYDQKQYNQATLFYDSVQMRQMEVGDINRIEKRKAILSRLGGYNRLVAKEDSLQRIAGMPDEERTVYITRLVKQMRKQQGLQETVSTSGNPLNNPATDLFPGNSQPKGEWYFYNTTLKTQGIVQFRQIWGTRPNVDNWRRFSDVNQQLLSKVPTNTRDANIASDANIAADNTPSYNALLNNLPLTEEKIKLSNDSIQVALFGLGTTYLNELEDYASSIVSFEKIRTRFPGYARMDEVLFNLYYAYKKIGNDAKAEEVKKLLQARAPSSRFASIIMTGKDPATNNRKNPEATKVYESIYSLFIEGKFEEAALAKRKADSLYQTSFWQPQLLYIQAVYQIKQRNDSVAKNILQTLIAQSGDSPLGAKAQNLVQVLNRRKQIEDELTMLQNEKPREDSVVAQKQIMSTVPSNRKDSIANRPKNNVVIKPNQPTDTTVKRAIVQSKPLSVFKFDASMKHDAVIILDKVDPLFANEVKTAFARFNRDYYYNQPFQITMRELDASIKLVVVSGFSNAQEAVDYVLKAKGLAANEIMPWLTKDKYAFSIISSSNFDMLKDAKDLVRYRQFLDQNLPVKL